MHLQHLLCLCIRLARKTKKGCHCHLLSRIFVSFVANWVVLWKNFLEGPTASAIIRFVCNDDNAIKKHYREVFYEKTVFICTVV